jgi:amino acid adenylation domain-containing protein
MVPVMYSVADLLTVRARNTGSATAVESGSISVTYRQLAAQAQRRAAQLTGYGVRPGDRVALLLPRGVEAAAAFFGTLALGAVAVFVGDTLKRRQVSHIVRHSEARVVYCDARLRPLLDEDELAGTRVVDVAQPVVDGPVDGARVVGGDLATLMYTSGSTGAPKGVMFTHDNLIAGAAIVADYLQLGPADRTLSILPWSFDYGLNQLLATVYAGGTLIPCRSTFAPDICRALRASRATGLAGVPPLWELLTRRPSPFLERPLPQLRYVTNSGGALRPATVERIRDAHPDCAVVLMYGLTEAFRSTYLPPDQMAARLGSIGVPVPGAEILVLDEAGRPAAPGEVGELVHSGPTVAAGYWRDPAATARVFRPHPFPPAGATPRYVVYSGDYVRRDADGYHWYVGRRDEMFKSRGTRVNPGQVERELGASGLVSEAVVFGTPDGAGDTSIVAVVVPAAPDAFDRAALDAYCAEHLPPHLRPGEIVVVTELPRTGSGKLDRTAVRAAYPVPAMAPAGSGARP